MIDSRSAQIINKMPLRATTNDTSINRIIIHAKYFNYKSCWYQNPSFVLVIVLLAVFHVSAILFKLSLSLVCCRKDHGTSCVSIQEYTGVLITRVQAGSWSILFVSLASVGMSEVVS